MHGPAARRRSTGAPASKVCSSSPHGSTTRRLRLRLGWSTICSSAPSKARPRPPPRSPLWTGPGTDEIRRLLGQSPATAMDRPQVRQDPPPSPSRGQLASAGPG